MPTDEQIKMLAKVSRDMDSGKLKYVVDERDGTRYPVEDDILEQLGLEHGQKVNDIIIQRIFEVVMLRGVAAMIHDIAYPNKEEAKEEPPKPESPLVDDPEGRN